MSQRFGEKLRHRVGRWGSAALDLVLPPQCVTCDAPVGEPGRFCAACFLRIRLISDPACRRCGVPMERAVAGGVCGACLETPPGWRQARAAMVYDEHSRGLVLGLKHGDRTELAQALGAMMARAGAGLLEDADLLVPVPLHPSRLRRRGYNQAALLARQVGRGCKIEVAVDALVRMRPTRALAELSAEAREAALAGVIAVRRGATARLAGRRVVVVDDVLTSGATCEACTQALLAAGVASVDVLVAARVPDPRAEGG